MNKHIILLTKLLIYYLENKENILSFEKFWDAEVQSLQKRSGKRYEEVLDVFILKHLRKI